MINTTVKDYRRGWRRNNDASAACKSPISEMLNFYSIECALKYLHLKKLKLKDSNELQDNNIQLTHDIRQTIIDLRLEGVGLNNADVPNFRLKNTRNPLHIKQAHEAWRYGVEIEEEDQKKLKDWLQNASELLKKEVLNT
ncbi:hypothetical protein RYZ26_14690 [Terasakiella sp. A23]|uniref:hypothetical protein n=1 Tax=Terasakiella sp. FCG-A23 TaxID=3080561 RepID=UPI0029533196|nr:hypothetical protein [Terasakiella sp. A23]MDV7340851.1 hypothetical protein [Terasakiella sp. A23]